MSLKFCQLDISEKKINKKHIRVINIFLNGQKFTKSYVSINVYDNFPTEDLFKATFPSSLFLLHVILCISCWVLMYIWVYVGLCTYQKSQIKFENK